MFSKWYEIYNKIIMDIAKKKFIAYFDILGYENRIRDKSIIEEFEVQLRFINEQQSFIDNSRNIIKSHTLHFSDTHIIYTEDASSCSFSKIITDSLRFMCVAAIRFIPYLPVRGAISYGDFCVDTEKNIIIGKALREAYDLEKNQQWMGCCLSDSCYEQVKDDNVFNHFVEKGVLVEYLVPFKNKREKKYAVNMESFPRFPSASAREMPMHKPEFIKNIFINRGMNNKDLINLTCDAKKKLRNTQKFFNYVFKQKFPLI